MKNLSVLLLMVALLISCSKPTEQQANYRVVPLPQDIAMMPGQQPFVLNSATKIVCTSDSLVREAQFLQEYIADLTGHELRIVSEPTDNAIVVEASLDNANKEAYNVTVNDKQIVINGASAAGTFYGIQMLRKSIPAKVVPSDVVFAAAQISDSPRFGYRGALLDIARHPMEPDSVKVFIDMLAMHNINKLHWHITDDQGWRIEIKKYPLLTEISSKRPGTMIERNFNEFDTIPVEGYITQEEAKDLVKYAAERHITIIPEIDLPGHMVAALEAYPQLGCTGGPYKVWQKWGVSEDLLCAGNDSTYIFLDDVLNEVADIFPSEYIHIGGDECPKVRWHNCPKCQAKIKELGIKGDKNASAEAKLQTYVMDRALQTLAKRGRRAIGWDEILEGGAPADAIIMSWRGTSGAYQAAKSGHDAILTPTEYCYFDYCQSIDKSTEPVGIGGYVPVEKVYSLEPIPAEFTPEEAAHILGVQANLWREYIKTLSHAQYMELPRLAALSEVQWMQPEQKNYDDFLQRVQQLVNHYDAAGYNYARHIYDVKGDIVSDPEAKEVVLTLSTASGSPIYYTLDGSTPDANSTVYTEPLHLDKSANIQAITYDAKGNPSHLYHNQAIIGKSTFKPLTLKNAPAPRYTGGGPAVLTDGLAGRPMLSSPEWLGFDGKDFDATIDLGSPQEVHSATVRFFIDTPSWVYNARAIKVEVSTDGKKFKQVASQTYPAMDKHTTEMVSHTVNFDPVEAQYVRVVAEYEKSIPAWHSAAAGRPAFLFVDEVTVD